MRKSKFTESQVVGILKEAESGVPVADLLRRHGISRTTFFKWRSKYAGASVADVKRLRELEGENAKLKRMYADLIQTTEWLTIPERGLSTGVAIFGAVGSGKTSACMPPFTRQLLSWQANNPDRRVAALVLEVKGDFRRRRAGESGVVC